MDIDLLRNFLAVAEELNFTRASERIHISQPTLSRNIMELESELGKTLFIRGKRKLELTDSGQLLKDRAIQIIELVDKTSDEISTASEELTGTLYIGAAETDGIRLVGEVIQELMIDHPKIKLDIYSGDGISVREHMEKGLSDFGLVYGNIDYDRYHVIDLPYADSWGVLMRSDDIMADKEYITREDLLGKPLLTSRGSLHSGIIQKWFDSDNSSMNIVTVGNLILNSLKLVRMGFGYLLALDGLVNTDNNSDYVFVPIHPQLNYPLKFVWKRHHTLSPTAQAFAELMQARYGS